MDRIYFMVEFGNIHFFTYAFNREGAKGRAVPCLGGDPDNYIVTPLTKPGDRIVLDYTYIAT